MRNESLVKRLTTWVFIASVFLLFIFGAFSEFSQLTREFTGSKEFTSVEEAQTFQGEVVKATLEVRGRIVSSDLSMQSPPRLTFHIILPLKDSTAKIFSGDYAVSLPQETSFKYGSRGASVAAAWAGISFITLLALSAVGFFTWAIWIEE